MKRHVVKFGGGYFIMTTAEYLSVCQGGNEFKWRELPYPKATREDIEAYADRRRVSELQNQKEIK